MNFNTHLAITAAIAFGFTTGGAMAAQKNGNLSAGTADKLTNRIWMEAMPANGLPGVMMTFFSDGTLLQDSCWETYTLASWKVSSANKLDWTENGIRVSAEVISVSTIELVLEVKVGKSKILRVLQAAKAPFICPDMKK